MKDRAYRFLIQTAFMVNRLKVRTNVSVDWLSFEPSAQKERGEGSNAYTKVRMHFARGLRDPAGLRALLVCCERHPSPPSGHGEVSASPWTPLLLALSSTTAWGL